MAAAKAKQPRLSAAEKFAAIQAWPPFDELTEQQWDTVVATWNTMDRDKRTPFARRCREAGHRWVRTPVGTEVCLGCVSYRPAS
jgi:hypothetical protein